MAFGTGHHETTRLAAQAVAGLLAGSGGRMTVLDIGTGTGILCFVADCCKAAKAVGIDIDNAYLANVAENRTDNPPQAAVHFAIASCEAIKQNAQFDIIVMNILSLHSLPVLAAIRRHLKSHGRFIWSGLLSEQKASIIEAAKEKGLKLCSDSNDGEWWCGTFALAE
jgi:ribosomal protein L11 methyltransferase